MFLGNIRVYSFDVSLFSIQQGDVVDETGCRVFCFVYVELVVMLFEVLFVVGATYLVFLFVNKQKRNFVLIKLLYFGIYISFAKDGLKTFLGLLMCKVMQFSQLLG